MSDNCSTYKSLTSITSKAKSKSALLYGLLSRLVLPTRGGVEDTRFEAKAKDTKKYPKPRTDTLEAKDRNARGQGQGPRTQAKVLSKKKERFSQKFFKRSPRKNVFQKIFQALHKILTIQKIVLSSSREQANF